MNKNTKVFRRSNFIKMQEMSNKDIEGLLIKNSNLKQVWISRQSYGCQSYGFQALK